MARLTGARLSLVTASIHLLAEVQSGKHNYILVGPEQAALPEFREILRSSDFKKVGLVVIDECHTIAA